MTIEAVKLRRLNKRLLRTKKVEKCFTSGGIEPQTPGWKADTLPPYYGNFHVLGNL